MDFTALVGRLERTAEAVDALVAGLSDEDWRWRPAEGGWSILEVVNHLVDEEVFDFRTRVKSTLEDPTRDWPQIDPERWAIERRYQDRAPAESLARFREERTKSLAWLRGLTSPDWDRARHHPRGPLRSGDLMASWAAHDARHLAQIAKRLHGLAARDGTPYSVQYAG
jgi:uncharacterized damage-inducible protein DinB